MFYIIKRQDEKQFNIGDVVMSLADFSGVQAGSKGVVTQIYDGGLMVTWEGRVIHSPEFRGMAMIDDILKLLKDSDWHFGGMAVHGWLSDGFSREDLEYLVVRSEKHPTKS